MLGLNRGLGELMWKLTAVTLKSYPQTSHPGAFSKSSASKEDSPLIPKSIDRKHQERDRKCPGFAENRGLSSGIMRTQLTERVDDTFFLLLDVLEATDPFSAVAHGTDPSCPVWALESRNEEVPYSRWNENRQVDITGKGKSGE